MKVTSSTEKMPIDILLVEPDYNLREQLAIVLTTTGGYAVEAKTTLPRQPPENARLLLLPSSFANKLASTSYPNFPHLFITNTPSLALIESQFNPFTNTNDASESGCLGVVVLRPVTAVAERVREKLKLLKK